jgi:hypothetical protein
LTGENSSKKHEKHYGHRCTKRNLSHGWNEYGVIHADRKTREETDTVTTTKKLNRKEEDSGE